MKRAITLTSILGLLNAAACDAGGSGGPSNEPPPPDGPVPVALQEVAAGLSVPLYLTAPPGDSRLFIVEKGGAIRVVKDGALLPTPFLDLSTGSPSAPSRVCSAWPSTRLTPPMAASLFTTPT